MNQHKPDPDSTVTRSNRRRIAMYDELIRKATARVAGVDDVATRRAHLKLIGRLDARCRREIQRREDMTRA